MELTFETIAISAGVLVAIVFVIRVKYKSTKNSYNKFKDVGGDVHIGDKK